MNAHQHNLRGVTIEVDEIMVRFNSMRRYNSKKNLIELDRKVNLQRYRLSSGAELIKINISNYNNPSLHIWTRVGNERFDDV